MAQDINALLNMFKPQEDQNLPPVPYRDDYTELSTPIKNLIPKTELSVQPEDLKNLPKQEYSKEEQILNDVKQFDSSKPEKNALSVEDLENLLKQRQSSYRNIGLLDAANDISSGIARLSGAKVDKPNLDNLYKQADMPLQDFSTKLKGNTEVEMSDPNSDISKFSRERAQEMMKRFNPKFDVKQFENLSAAQLEKLGFKSALSQSAQPKVQFQRILDENGNVKLKAFDTATGNEVQDLGIAGFANQFRNDPNTGNITQLSPSLRGGNPTLLGKSNADYIKPNEQSTQKMNRKDLTPNDKKLLDDTRAKLASNDQYKAAQDAVDASQSVDILLANGKVNGDIVRALQNKLARATGEKGAMTENDVAPFGGRASILDRFERMLTTNINGKIPDTDRKFLGQINKVLNDAAKRNIDEVNSQFATQLSDDTGLSLDQAAKLLNTQERLNPKQLSKQLKSGQNQQNNVQFPKQVRKDGKVATVKDQSELDEALAEGWK